MGEWCAVWWCVGGGIPYNVYALVVASPYRPFGSSRRSAVATIILSLAMPVTMEVKTTFRETDNPSSFSLQKQHMVAGPDGLQYVILKPSDGYFARFVAKGATSKSHASFSLTSHDGFHAMQALRNAVHLDSFNEQVTKKRDATEGVASGSALQKIFNKRRPASKDHSDDDGFCKKTRRLVAVKEPAPHGVQGRVERGKEGAFPSPKVCDESTVTLDLCGVEVQVLRPFKASEPLKVPCDAASMDAVVAFVRSYEGVDNTAFFRTKTYALTGKYARKGGEASDDDPCSEEAEREAIKACEADHKAWEAGTAAVVFEGDDDEAAAEAVGSEEDNKDSL